MHEGREPVGLRYEPEAELLQEPGPVGVLRLDKVPEPE